MKEGTVLNSFHYQGLLVLVVVMINQIDIEGRSKVDIAIERLRQFEPKEPYYVAISGGKDSDVIVKLCELAGVKYELYHQHTTADAPQTVRYIRETYPSCHIDYPEESIWKLIEKQGVPPTRLMRYCCKILKEYGGEGRTKGKARPRWSRKGASMYTPLETKQYENYIAHCFRIAGGEKIEGAIMLNITMLFAIPKNVKKSNRELYRLNKVLPTKKPDIDNCLKAVMDGLNKVAYEDDKQVVENHVIKRWTTGVERLEIEIVEAEGDEEHV